MCRMIADSLEELHSMADKISLRRSWFESGEKPYYGLCKNNREKALKAGATEWKEPTSICAYCNEPIELNQPSVVDEWGDKGARMHLYCAVEDQDGQDLDRDMGDS